MQGTLPSLTLSDLMTALTLVALVYMLVKKRPGSVDRPKSRAKPKPQRWDDFVREARRKVYEARRSRK